MSGNGMASRPPGVWNVCGYVRLSREDGAVPDAGGNPCRSAGRESNSVTGQKELIRDYLGGHPELVECDMKVDDGYSGLSFERPAFREMMDAVKEGNINCIIVKDLSRFGRNYLEAGEYIERIFPFLGVRFIAINDHYDSLYKKTESDALLIPFKNLINEAYCRDISVKIRTQLAVRRRRGDFTGSFAVYGYLKDPQNRHHLVKDEFAAGVVRDLFRWKLEGMSAGDIADRLNREGVSSPLDYKKSQGLRFFTPFGGCGRSLWNATTVLRILKNPVYTGVLEQGKSTAVCLKVKRRVAKPRSGWDIVEGTHEALVGRDEFTAVQRVLARDIRTGLGNPVADRLSGMVYCGECGAAMVRKTVPSGKKKYIYYVCAAHKNKKSCSAHSVRDSVLEEIVLKSVQKQMESVIGAERLAELSDAVFTPDDSAGKLRERLDRKNGEISRFQRLLDSLYENLEDGIISREEYTGLKKKYGLLLAQAKEQAGELCLEKECAPAGGTGSRAGNRKYQKLTEPDRAAVVILLERILVYRDRRVEIICDWKDQMPAAADKK